jgi:hypothetical protein
VSRPRKAWHGIAGFLKAAKAATLDRWSSGKPREQTLWTVGDLGLED